MGTDPILSGSNAGCASLHYIDKFITNKKLLRQELCVGEYQGEFRGDGLYSNEDAWVKKLFPSGHGIKPLSSSLHFLVAAEGIEHLSRSGL